MGYKTEPSDLTPGVIVKIRRVTGKRNGYMRGRYIGPGRGGRALVMPFGHQATEEVEYRLLKPWKTKSQQAGLPR